MVAALRRLADELAMPLGSVLLTAHAKVLGALSGEREVSTGYAVEARSPLPCRMTTEPQSWRAVLVGNHPGEVGVLLLEEFSVGGPRRELGLIKPVVVTMMA